MSLRIRFLFVILAFIVLPSVTLAVASLSQEKDEVFVRIPDHYLSANNFSVPSSGKVLVADLEKMRLDVYEDGRVVSTFPILSRGRKGTPWETPSGVYQVLLKEKNHFSSLGHVFMPWSMQFYGNFFIHGWPYDVDGNDVPRGYSGGCIRLATSDAESIYRFVERGTPIIVRAKDAQHLSGGYYVSTNSQPPELSLQSLVVMDLDRGQILWKKDAEHVFPDLLTGKLLSALASLEHMNQYSPRTLPEPSLIGRSWITRRSELPAKDLIAPLLFGQDTTIERVLARAHGTNAFLHAMNQKAQAFGMVHTSIHDLGGASTTNMTSASDMVHLLRALDQSKRYLLELTGKPVVAVPDTEGEEPSVVLNTFLLPGDVSVRGGMADVKSGNALFVFTLPFERGERSLAVAVGESTDVLQDIERITQYLSDGVTYMSNTEDGVVSGDAVGFFAKIRMIWNRKRIGDMLLGKEHAPASLVLMSALRSDS